MRKQKTMHSIFKNFYEDYKQSIEKTYSKLFYSFVEIDGVKIYFRKSDFILLNDCLNTIRMENKEETINKYTVVKDYCKMLNSRRQDVEYNSLFSNYYKVINVVDGYFFHLTQEEIDGINIFDLKQTKKKIKVYNPYNTFYQNA